MRFEASVDAATIRQLSMLAPWPSASADKRHTSTPTLTAKIHSCGTRFRTSQTVRDRGDARSAPPADPLRDGAPLRVQAPRQWRTGAGARPGA